MKTETILRNARERIANRDNWVRGAMYAPAKQKDGSDNFADVTGEVHVGRLPLSRAKCFCSVGSVAATLGVPAANFIDFHRLLGEDWVVETKGKDFSRAIRYLDAAAEALGVNSAWAFNDTRSHEQVLAMFDLAIKRARRRHAHGG